MHLDRGDSQGVFARAISSDGRSYRDEVKMLSWDVFLSSSKALVLENCHSLYFLLSFHLMLDVVAGYLIA